MSRDSNRYSFPSRPRDVERVTSRDNNVNDGHQNLSVDDSRSARNSTRRAIAARARPVESGGIANISPKDRGHQQRNPPNEATLQRKLDEIILNKFPGVKPGSPPDKLVEAFSKTKDLQALKTLEKLLKIQGMPAHKWKEIENIFYGNVQADHRASARARAHNEQETRRIDAGHTIAADRARPLSEQNPYRKQAEARNLIAAAIKEADGRVREREEAHNKDLDSWNRRHR